MAHEQTRRTVIGAERAVLFLHGILGTPDHFLDYLPLVPENMSYSNLRLHGHGASVRDFSRASMTKWENQVEAEVNRLLSTHKSLYIVGHSKGTLLAIEQAVKHKEVAGLFLLAVPVKLRLTLRTIHNSMKAYFDWIKPTDAVAMAAKRCYGVARDKNPFHYLGWLPRFLELSRKSRRTLRLLPQLTVPCRAYQSRRDETVPDSATRLLKEHSAMTVEELPDSSHYYYTERDYEWLLKDFQSFLQ